MTERLVIERATDGGLDVEMTTTVGDIGELTVRKHFPRAPDLSQHRVLELQADLLQEAVALLTHKLQASRRLDRDAPTPDE